MAKNSGKGTDSKKGKGGAKTDESSDKPAKVCPDAKARRSKRSFEHQC